MQGFRTIGFFVVGAIGIIAISLLWPRFTDAPRPLPLTKIRDAVLLTQAGRNTANVPGVSDEASAAPVNIVETATNTVQSVISGVTAYAANTITVRIFDSLLTQFDQLPEEQKELFRQKICVPPASDTTP